MSASTQSAWMEKSPAETASPEHDSPEDRPAVSGLTAPVSTTTLPMALLEMAPARVETCETEDGALILRSPLRLAPPPRRLLDALHVHAEAAPERIFLGERSGTGGWRTLTYQAALREVRRLSQGLLDHHLGPDHPLMILSDNSIDHALMSLAAMYGGIPVVPVSPAYSLQSQDHNRLQYLLELVRPGLIFAAEGVRFAPVLKKLRISPDRVVFSHGEEALPGARSLASLAAAPSPKLDAAFERVGPETVAKILFTSGSTGVPKGVINTQGMLTANQQSIAQLWPFLEQKPPVVLDWLPWSHTFGGNHNFNMVLRHGGTLYIDDGKPAPGLLNATLRNIREISPSLYFNVPRGFDMLVPQLEQDEGLRNAFFKHLDLIFYAAAALPQHLWVRLEALSVQARGVRVMMVSAWGSTETSPLATSVHFPIERAGVIGLPAPGVDLKLAPVGNKRELRVRGPNVTPGYYLRPDLTEAAFDAEGFYRTGDAGVLFDPADPARGVVFDGRIAEDFKLMSGTWVHVGALRIQILNSVSPLVQDLVVTGHGREQLGILCFPNVAFCRGLAEGLSADASMEQVLQHPAVLAQLRERLGGHNRIHTGNSMRVWRALFLAEPPSIDANEITDKGYINQRAVLERRSREVARLFEERPGPEVVEF